MPNRWTERLQSTWATRGGQPTASPVPEPAEPSAARGRTEVCPPARLYQRSRWRCGLREWLNTGWDVSSPAPLAAVPSFDSLAPEPSPASHAEIHQAFMTALDDIDSVQATALRLQITRARSPRELWHLRSALYTLVATHHTEFQARQRMDLLNRHFPHRAMRTEPGSR
ncbi:MAG: hypothetical protein K2X42_02340 [Burkholderiaceae bacterium]|nr:hypothetical protein [Burkholderiaceae bacterium]